MRASILLLTVASATLGMAACEQAELTNPSRTESSAASEPVAVDLADVVATVHLENGGVATVLDLGDGHFGVAQVTPIPSRVRTAPRSSAGPLAEPGYDSYECDPFGDEWVADWKDAFVGITKYRSAIYYHFQPGSKKFYPGAAAFNGTNTNSVTYLGACNGDEHDDLVMEVHRRRNDGSWVRIHQATIESFQKFTWYSGVPAIYRGFTYGADKATIEHYGVGAAWTLSPGKATP